ncbi:hypothetical protein SPHINGOR109_50367 [Sphingorhabdus sp. 109]|nr:hypothetical protein SPHINGOR109_50367 [Sphingorhabdus sp. 109]
MVPEQADLTDRFLPEVDIDLGLTGFSSGEIDVAPGEMNEAEFRMFLAETLGACATVSRSGTVHFICMDWRHMHEVTASVGDIVGFRGIQFLASGTAYYSGTAEDMERGAHARQSELARLGGSQRVNCFVRPTCGQSNL